MTTGGKEGGGRGDTNLINPTRHRLDEVDEESETYQPEESEKVISNPTWEGSDHFQFLHKAVPQKLLQGEKKLTALLSRVPLKDVDRQ